MICEPFCLSWQISDRPICGLDPYEQSPFHKGKGSCTWLFYVFQESKHRSTLFLWLHVTLNNSLINNVCLIYNIYCSLFCGDSKSLLYTMQGGYSKTFYTGRLRPKVQPLTLLYTIFSEKAPLSYTFYREKAPLSYTFLRRLMNKS